MPVDSQHRLIRQSLLLSIFILELELHETGNRNWPSHSVSLTEV